MRKTWAWLTVIAIATGATACGAARERGPKPVAKTTSSAKAAGTDGRDSAPLGQATAAATSTPAEGNAPTRASSGDKNEAEARERAKAEELQRQLDAAKDDTKRAELQSRLEEKEKQKPRADAHTTAPRSEPPVASPKPACRCMPGDPLCSCVDDGQPPPPPPPPKAKRKASVRAASTTSMSGRISREQVESAVAEHIDVFASCTDADVTVSVKALIADTGKVTEASARRSTPDVVRLRDCVVSAFKTIQFPSSGDGKSVPIEFDLVLSPSS